MAIGAANRYGTQGYGIGADAQGNVYVAGYYYSSGGGLPIRNFVAPSTYGDNMFVGRIDYTPTDIQLVQDATAISVYPNPSDGQYWFTGLGPGNTIEVYDIIGNLITTTQAEASNYSLNLGGKAKGIYLYRITDTSGLIHQGKITLQ